MLISSTFDPAHFISDGYQSPYNVAKVIHLDDYTEQEVAELNRCYGALLRTETEQKSFHWLFGGIPALSQIGLKLMAQDGLRYKDMESIALSEQEPFCTHLRMLQVPLMRDKEAIEAVRELLKGRACPTDKAFYCLRTLGLVRGSTRQNARIRCELYRTFLAAKFP